MARQLEKLSALKVNRASTPGYLGDGGAVETWQAEGRADDVAGLWPAIAALLPK